MSYSEICNLLADSELRELNVMCVDVAGSESTHDDKDQARVSNKDYLTAYSELSQLLFLIYRH